MSPSCFGIGAVSALWLSGRNCPYFRAVSASWLFRPELLSASLGSVDTYTYSRGEREKNDTAISSILKRKPAFASRISAALAQALQHPLFAANLE